MKPLLICLSASAFAVSPLAAGLAAYDNKIASDNGAGLPYLAVSATTLNFDGSNAEPFDFGAVSGSATIEFIVGGDPVAGGRNGYLGVGSNATFSLRYEQWDDTGQLGFTHGGVADYVFEPADLPPVNTATASPTELTHVTYRWDAPSTTMELYINGELAGINTTATGFQMPAGSGLLGNNAGLTEGMLGTIERFTAYNEAVDPATILAHAEAWDGPGGSLANYDTVIADDHAGALPHTAISTTPFTFDTTNAEALDFGGISGSATFEFIVEGDPVGGGQDGFLAVGTDPIFSLRFEQWNDTGQLGFTHGGVADYVFLPADVPVGPSLESPTELTHVTYRWDQDTTTMDLFLDGVLAGTNSAATGFAMPTGQGFLGNNAAMGEGMLGVMERVTVYNSALADSVIIDHANAWLGVQALTLNVLSDADSLTFIWSSQDRKVYDLLSSTVLDTDPDTWTVFGGNEGIAATPPENTFTIPRPADPLRFFVIQERPVPPFFVDDFESGRGSWTTGSDGEAGTSWELGSPSDVGPPAANSGANLFGTNLGSNYAENANVWLRSPTFDLTDAGISGAELQFAQFVDIEPMFDFGSVRVVDAATNAPLGPVLADAIDGTATAWETFSAPLPPEALGEMIKIEFRLQADDFGDFAGWYIDDVALTLFQD